MYTLCAKGATPNLLTCCGGASPTLLDDVVSGNFNPRRPEIWHRPSSYASCKVLAKPFVGNSKCQLSFRYSHHKHVSWWVPYACRVLCRAVFVKRCGLTPIHYCICMCVCVYSECITIHIRRAPAHNTGSGPAWCCPRREVRWTKKQGARAPTTAVLAPLPPAICPA